MRYVDRTSEKLFLKLLNVYLEEVFKNNDKCKQCIFNHNGEFCFFAFDCVKDNFRYYKTKKD